MSQGYADNLETSATVISLLFMGEMTLKLSVLGCSDYWGDK